MDAYLYIDDADLDVHLRKVKHSIVFGRVVAQDIYKVAFESHGTPEEVDLYSREQILKDGIPVYSSTQHGSSFSKLKATQEPIYVLKSAVKVKQWSLYPMSAALGKSQFVASISRLFVPSEPSNKPDIMNKLSVQPEGFSNRCCR